MADKLKIIVVANEPGFRRFMQEALDEFGDIYLADDGEEALKNIPCFKPHIILLDIIMPDINGLEVCRRIRLSKFAARVAIILVSARAMNEDIENGLRAGANAYLTKPFHHDRLINLIEQYRQTLLMPQSPELLFIDRPIVPEKHHAGFVS